MVRVCMYIDPEKEHLWHYLYYYYYKPNIGVALLTLIQEI